MKFAKLLVAVLVSVLMAGMAQAGETKLLYFNPEPVALPAVPKFVAKDAFTKANGIIWTGDNFKRYILPLVEENVPGAAIQASKLTRDARDFAIVAELQVHERGEMALAHFFRAIQDRIAGISTDGWANVAYIIGTDGETWVVSASLDGGGWNVDAVRLGVLDGWNAGSRFLSRSELGTHLRAAVRSDQPHSMLSAPGPTGGRFLIEP